MAALDIKPTDRVLDFGCGSGYMTVEMAKLAAKATGIDVNPYVASIKVPRSLATAGSNTFRPPAPACRFPTPASIAFSRPKSCR